MRSLKTRLASTRAVILLVAALLFSSVYIAFWKRLPNPPQEVWLAFFNMGVLLLHLALGWAMLVVVTRTARSWWKAIRSTGGGAKALGALSLLATIVCLAAGVGLLFF